MAVQDMGMFVPNTFLFDVQTLSQIKNIDPALRELLIRLYQNLNLMALSLNKKTSGIYNDVDEFVTGNVFFEDPNPPAGQTPQLRQEYRKVINFGQLPDGTGGAPTKSVAHGIPINSSFNLTDIYGAAFDTTNLVGIPLNYVSNGAGPTGTTGNLEMWLDATNINVNATVDATNFDRSIIVIEYLKF